MRKRERETVSEEERERERETVSEEERERESLSLLQMFILYQVVKTFQFSTEKFLLFLEGGIIPWYAIGLRSKVTLKWGGSPGLVVMGDDSCSRGCGFESRRRILNGHFFTFVCLKRPKINRKKAEVGPSFLKKLH